MNPINLYMLTREEDPAVFSLYEQHLSDREEVRRTNAREQESLRLFVDALLHPKDGGAPVPADRLDGFYFSYTIRHIGKEFDLLKFSEDRRLILNIELKSESVGNRRIREQLLQNRYYLGHLSEKILSFTYVSSTGQLYMLNAHSYLVSCGMENLRQLLLDPSLAQTADGNIDDWFNTVEYLISPLGTPDKFLNGEYFLTNQQYDFRKQILGKIREGKRPLRIGIGGGAGTGKTLLLYDLAMSLSRKKKVRILHCGKLCEGHRIIDRQLRNVTIVTPDGEAAWPEKDSSDCDYLLVDEAGRMKSSLFSALLSDVQKKRIVCILCFDTDRFRFADADSRDLYENMRRQLDAVFTLSGNIRINRDLASFEKYLFDQKLRPKSRHFPSVEIRLAHDENECQTILSWYRARDFVVFPEKSAPTTGMEYARVLLVLDRKFFYGDDGVLKGASDPEENLGNLQSLYDSLSRVREKLCLLVIDNDVLFENLMRMVSPI